MNFKNIFFSALLLSTTVYYISASAASNEPIDEMPPLQLPAAAIPYQMPERVVPVVSTTEIRHTLTVQQQAELIEMLARLSLTE
ncbi:MAG: hypothetical protein NTZ68_04470 [Candidatus Dependentiae bacterium]|nr:hypothetical protein [Candidatus Dependentiae bacterium]